MDEDNYIMVHGPGPDCTVRLMRAEDVPKEFLPQTIKPEKIYSVYISERQELGVKILVAMGKSNKVYSNKGDGWYCKGKKLPYVEKGQPWTKK